MNMNFHAGTAGKLAARLVLLAVLALPLGGMSSFEALAAPSAELWPRWQKHDAAASQTVDHSEWDRLLDSYIRPDADGLNRFAYGEVTASDKAVLEDYIAMLSETPISSFGRAEQMAYWINLYNALTVKVILDHYPVESIRDIDTSPGWFSDGPWGMELVTVEGEALTLDDIEHRILRPIWRDPRIHYAVNCASVGCPNLQKRAFTGENAEALLEAGARAYINSPRGVQIENGELQVSSIYVWFAEDFGDSDEAIIQHLKRYAEPPLAENLERAEEIDGHDYDWRLNG